MPVELTSLIRLGTLNLSKNHLTGIIPAKIGKLEWIETLDLSMNQLSGSIPPSMVSLTFLNYLNLSYNHLSGKVPTGNQFSTLLDPSIYKGNAALCGYPLPNGCRDNEETPQVPGEEGQQGDDSGLEKLWLIVSIVIGFIVGFWGVCGSLVINKSWRHAYFNFLDKVKYALIDFVSAIGRHLQKRSRGTEDF
ncbi:receptor-like protein EIX2 [Rosa rugosa]|uniref:receptor-like protein EIX2 n=1 Tax=Rosa rugosa TaxID=74645 RepID=UPI002B40ABE2|nr:receptor-like protein EIX2 [Rosa rugosa]